MTIKKTNLPTPLDYVEEAFIDCILNMSESEIDAELRELNLDPEKVAAETKAAIERGIVATNKASLVVRETNWQRQKPACPRLLPPGIAPARSPGSRK